MIDMLISAGLFMNLPYERDEYEAILSKVIWLEEKKQEPAPFESGKGERL